jgi:predicted 2-oxoglutarate/Fe(II)-dependent dioxygenase YbiX/peroxiredoxin
MSTVEYRLLSPGVPAPWFRQRCTSNEDYSFDTVAGRYILLCFFGSMSQPPARARMAAALSLRELFDDQRLALFGISVDRTDEAQARVRESMPGIRHFWDFDGSVSRLYGAQPLQGAGPDGSTYRPQWVLLNPNLQVRRVLPFATSGSDLQELPALLRSLPPVDGFAGVEMHAPVIVLPDLFEPAFCRMLIERYEGRGGRSSGFMREVGGLTTSVNDASHKVRRDHLIGDEPLQQQIQQRMHAKVRPVLQRVHCFDATRMERYLVACYDAAEGGHFQPHRDNTTRGTAHRRFALSVNPNDDFEGGELVFPEYGARGYKPPAGAGVIFSCSLLHAVQPVRRGRRYAFLPFFYDEAAAAVREANAPFLVHDGEPYRAHAGLTNPARA